MRRLLRILTLVVVVAVLGLAVAYVVAGTRPGPAIEVRSPARWIGQDALLEWSADAPSGHLTDMTAVLEQEGTSETVFSLQQASALGDVQRESDDRVLVRRPIGKTAVPSLKAGPARLTVTASRPVLYGLRQVSTTVTKDLEVRLDPPRIGAISLHHFVNHGGAEFVVYRVTPPEGVSGVLVGQTEYRGFPGTAVGLSDPALHVVFFALAHDQDLRAPIRMFARDDAGNSTIAPLDHRVFPKPFAKSRIEIDDRFLERVVPAIDDNTPSLDVARNGPPDLLAGFIKINGELRRQNNHALQELAARTRPEMLWTAAFSQLGNSAVQSRFADYRTYFYRGKEIDRQVHLGFDLASLAQAPVHASNAGLVIFSGFLGIYGNAVVLDHGLGVQSLYAHLSSSLVRDGHTVDKGQEIGRTGITGLAAGDHLHFTMLVNGTAVNPVEWWDPHWMQDRVVRKIREAGAASAAP